MEKGRFYKSKQCSDVPEGIYMLYDQEKLSETFQCIKIAKVKAILIDRVIFDRILEFITEKPENIFKCFTEIDFITAKKSIDNTETLLNKDIFRR